MKKTETKYIINISENLFANCGILYPEMKHDQLNAIEYINYFTIKKDNVFFLLYFQK